jgi:hypothetical protein
MSLKKLFGLEKENITDDELRKMLAEARKAGKEHIKIYSTKITFKRNDSRFIECGILD